MSEPIGTDLMPKTTDHHTRLIPDDRADITHKLRRGRKKRNRKWQTRLDREFKLLLLGRQHTEDNSVKIEDDIDSIKSRKHRTHGQRDTTLGLQEIHQIESNVPRRIPPDKDSSVGTCHFEAGGSFVDMEGSRDFREGSGSESSDAEYEDYQDYDITTEILTTPQIGETPKMTKPTTSPKPETSTKRDMFVFEYGEDNELTTETDGLWARANKSEDLTDHFDWGNRVAGILTTLVTTSSYMQTTPKLGVTDDIIFSGAGPGCHSDDEDDCTSLGSGTEDDIIHPTVIIETTPSPPTTTPPPKPEKCSGPNCSGKNPWIDESMSSTSNGNMNQRPGETIDGHSGNIDGLKPTGETSGESVSNNKHEGGGGSPLNIGLIIGIAAGVLVAILILIFALYKFRSRDEGTYKVDESQNFSYLESKKQQGNGALLGKGEETGKRGKKKDVKEWYV